MKNLKTYFSLMMLVAIIFSVNALSTVRASAPTLNVTIVNNSGWEIKHLYLSPADNDNWGDDQLNQSSIVPGATRTLTVSWEQSTVKLVSEDQDGCFLSKTIETSGNQTWTIAGNESRNCGSGQVAR
jgi:hypothetical protein